MANGIGVLVSLPSGAVQFLAEATDVDYDLSKLRVMRGRKCVAVYASGEWSHALLVRNWPDGFYKNEEAEPPKSNIWVIESPEEESDGVPGSPQP